MSDAETCPHCGSTKLDAEFVDVGVGGRGVQATPFVCYDCDARQFYDEEDAIDAFDVEIWCGWHMGPPIPGVPDAELVKRSNVWPLTDEQKTICAARRGAARQARKERLAREEANAARDRVRRKYIDEALF